MLFDLTHNLYMIISAIISIGILFCARIFIKEDNHKSLFLKFFAIITVLIHISSLWVDFLSTGTAVIQESVLFTIYPCNVMMWLLVICAFSKKPQSKFSKVLFEFTFYSGMFCGIIGIVLNENYASNPNILNWNILKGLLSHSTMIIGCAYLLVGKFINIRVSNTFSVFCGLILFLVNGYAINGLYLLFGRGEANSMYLQSLPFENLPWLNTYIMGLLALLVVFIFTIIFEQLFVNKEMRWYNQLSKNKQRKKI